jgi:hypothetical protein
MGFTGRGKIRKERTKKSFHPSRLPVDFSASLEEDVVDGSGGGFA